MAVVRVSSASRKPGRKWREYLRADRRNSGPTKMNGIKPEGFDIEKLRERLRKMLASIRLAFVATMLGVLLGHQSGSFGSLA